jgi:hypothetical protein
MFVATLVATEATMKKIIILLFAVLLTFTIMACGARDESEVPDDIEIENRQYNGGNGAEFNGDFDAFFYEDFGHNNIDWDLLFDLFERLHFELDEAFMALEDRLDEMTYNMWGTSQDERIDELYEQLFALEEETFDRLEIIIELVENYVINFDEFETNFREIIQNVREFNFV